MTSIFGHPGSKIDFFYYKKWALSLKELLYNMTEITKEN